MSDSTPFFQHGERPVRHASAVRYHKTAGEWTTSQGTLWLTNQRIVFHVGFGHQRNWPLDHITNVRIDTIEDDSALRVEFSNGMVEWFALENQSVWVTAIPVKPPKPKPTPKPAPASEPVFHSAITPLSDEPKTQPSESTVHTAEVESQPLPTPVPARRSSLGGVPLIGLIAAGFAVTCGCSLLVIATLLWS